MATLKLTYYNISQIAPYFKSIETLSNIPFGKRRSLSKLNEAFAKEVQALSEEINKIIEKYSEKDSEGKPLVIENGGIKMKEEYINQANKELEEVYLTEAEINYIPIKFKEEIFEKLECDMTTFKLIESNFIE